MTNSVSELRENLLGDFTSWSSLLHITHRETMQVVDWKLGYLQSEYVRKKKESKRKRRVILKPRQAYISTIINGENLHDCTTKPGSRVLTLTHHDDATRLFRETVRSWCTELDNIGMLPTVVRDNDDLLSFKTGSYWVFGTAGGKFGGRSAAFNKIHLSEVDFWQGDPHKAMGSLIPSAPKDADITIESTPQGADGVLHDYYNDAKNGDIDWDAYFWRWFDHPAYRIELSPEQKAAMKLTMEEVKLIGMYKLELEQIAWRRYMIAELKRSTKTEKSMFFQEYPEDDITCFLAGSDLVLDSDALIQLIGMVQEPLLEFNEWQIWKPPVDGVPYILMSDVSEGKNDYSACHIMDPFSYEEVAVYHGKTIPSHLSKIINDGGRAYNDALVVVETPGPGTVTLDRLMFQYGYSNIYYYTNPDTGVTNDEPGWPQNVRTRAEVISTLQELTQAVAFRVYHERTVRELASLTWRKVGSMRRARAEAAPGSHDDLALSLGLGLVVAPEIRKMHMKNLKGPNAGKALTVADMAGNRGPASYKNYNWDGVIRPDSGSEDNQRYGLGRVTGQGQAVNMERYYG